MSELTAETLAKRIRGLEEAFSLLQADPQNSMFRDSVIKRFEFTFETAQSLLRKFVAEQSVNAKERAHLTFPALIRTASQDGLLQNSYDVWHSFRDARNRSSHLYNEEQAIAVVEIVPHFLEEVRFLQKRLSEEMPNA